MKTFTVFPENAQNGRATVQGAMLIFDDTTGSPLALIDSDLVTYWKTAADSVYGASLLARPDSRTLVIVGTGVVAESLIDAYSAMFPELERIIVWGRNPAKSAALAARHQINGCVVEAATDLAIKRLANFQKREPVPKQGRPKCKRLPWRTRMVDNCAE